MHPRIAAYALLGFRSTAAFSGNPLLPSRRLTTQHKMSSSTTSDDDVVDIAANIGQVRQMIDDAIASSERKSGSVRLVAVSKTKPLELLQAAYETGQRYFGENYAQELMTKSAEMPDDVAWHFIGPLQSNKAASLVKKVGLAKLACIETISTLKLAAKLNRAVDAWNEESSGESKRLGIYIQVNTSGEDTKSGVTPGKEVCDLVKQISEECPSLSINGLMTIGAPGDDSCFGTLAECRDEVATLLGREPQELELSMGMSGDFEIAIANGATSIRVGSTIFGARDYSNLAK